MKVKATVSFSGAVSMIKGHIKDITDEQALNDLIACGYVVPVEDDRDASLKNATASKKKSKAVSGNENKGT